MAKQTHTHTHTKQAQSSDGSARNSGHARGGTFSEGAVGSGLQGMDIAQQILADLAAGNGLSQGQLTALQACGVVAYDRRFLSLEVLWIF